jgi:hypothetical protein
MPAIMIMSLPLMAHFLISPHNVVSCRQSSNDGYFFTSSTFGLRRCVHEEDKSEEVFSHFTRSGYLLPVRTSVLLLSALILYLILLISTSETK